MDVPGNHIVFQEVALPIAQPRKAGLEPAEHILVLITACHRVHGPSDQGNDRFLQDIAAAAKVHRHAVASKNTFNDRLIIPQIPGSHGDIPEAVLSRANQREDLGSNIFRLRKRRVGPVDGCPLAVSLPGPAAAEKGGGQISQSRSGLWGGEVVDLTGNTAPLSQPYQTVPGPEPLAEDLQRAVLLPHEGNGNGFRPPKEDGDHLLLLGCKIGKSVQEHVMIVNIARFLQVIHQLGHQIPPVLSLPVQPRLIGGIDQSQIPQLLPGEALQGGVQLPQPLRLHPVSLELIKECHQLSQKGSLPGGPGIHRQLWQHLLERQLHHKELTSGVQCAIRQASGERQHPVGQQPEAQHLPVTGGGGTAGAAQIHLRLVGGMLRHQQQLGAGIPQPPDLLQHLF